MACVSCARVVLVLMLMILVTTVLSTPTGHSRGRRRHRELAKHQAAGHSGGHRQRDHRELTQTSTAHNTAKRMRQHVSNNVPILHQIGWLIGKRSVRQHGTRATRDADDHRHMTDLGHWPYMMDTANIPAIDPQITSKPKPDDNEGILPHIAARMALKRVDLLSKLKTQRQPAKEQYTSADGASKDHESRDRFPSGFHWKSVEKRRSASVMTKRSVSGGDVDIRLAALKKVLPADSILYSDKDGLLVDGSFLLDMLGDDTDMQEDTLSLDRLYDHNH